VHHSWPEVVDHAWWLPYTPWVWLVFETQKHDRFPIWQLQCLGGRVEACCKIVCVADRQTY
jgi:hypothetical protein